MSAPRRRSGGRSRSGARWGRIATAMAFSALLLAIAVVALGGGKPPKGASAVLAIRLEGPVTPVMAEVLDHAIGRAEAESRPAVVVQLDTPGGLESSMRVMVKRMLASSVPVIVWIAPGGARAASAGVFITMAADVAAMAPGTNLGAATPINLQGPMDSTLARKATNDASAFARTVARQRGRNAEWAEDAVRHAVAASDSEAVRLRVVDMIAATMPELLERADGRSWRRDDETRALATRGLAVEWMDIGFRLRMMSMLADPNIAYLLMLLGFYGILFELQNPGAVLPGIVGGIALILALFALSTLPVNAAGLALLVLGVIFFVAEIKVASHGLLAAGGILAMLLGSLLLFRGVGVHVSYGVIAVGTLVTAAFFLFVVSAGVRARRRPVQAGAEAMVGQRAEAIERIAPSGRVSLGGVIWSARSKVEVESGSEVEVVAVDGLTLEVRPKTQEAQT